MSDDSDDYLLKFDTFSKNQGNNLWILHIFNRTFMGNVGYDHLDNVL